MSSDDLYSDDLYAAAEDSSAQRVLSISELTGQIKRRSKAALAACGSAARSRTSRAPRRGIAT